MASLFAQTTKGASFSKCLLYRYRLWRLWDEEKKPVVFVGLNPSTADAEHDDPTIRRCMNFAKLWGHGGLVMVNLFAYRSTDPRLMIRMGSRLAQPLDVVGPENDAYLLRAAQGAALVVAAWGTSGCFQRRDDDVKLLLAGSGISVHCLRRTKEGHPEHPLYMPADVIPEHYCGAAAP